jgi:hypothetical protein
MAYFTCRGHGWDCPGRICRGSAAGFDPVQGTGEAGPQLEIPLCASQVMVFDAKGFATE